MSQYRDIPDITLKANSGSSPAYRVVTVSGANTADIWKTATSLILGVSMEDASATGEAWKIRIAGTAKVACGASVSAGALVTPMTGTGKITEATKTYNTTTTVVPRSLGIALEAGSTNSVIEVLIMPNNIRKQAFS